MPRKAKDGLTKYQTQKLYWDEHPESYKRFKEQWRVWYKKQSTEYKTVRSRKHKLKSRYGLTEADYNLMLVEQGGCKMCGRPRDKVRRLNVDHCHKTGKVRGLLCSQCNTVLGIFESPLWWNRVKSYLGGVCDASEA